MISSSFTHRNLLQLNIWSHTPSKCTSLRCYSKILEILKISQNVLIFFHSETLSFRISISKKIPTFSPGTRSSHPIPHLPPHPTCDTSERMKNVAPREIIYIPKSRNMISLLDFLLLLISSSPLKKI